MIISKDQAKNVCLLGKGPTCCSYVGMGEDTIVCLKDTAHHMELFRRRMTGAMKAMGDNCSGPPDFIPTKEEVNDETLIN